MRGRWSITMTRRPERCASTIVCTLSLATESKLVAIIAPGSVDAVLAAMRGHPLGRDAALIGEVVEDEHRFVQMTTGFGGGRIVDWLSGEQLSRIC